MHAPQSALAAAVVLAGSPGMDPDVIGSGGVEIW